MRFHSIPIAGCWLAAVAALGCGPAGMGEGPDTSLGEVPSAATAATMPAPVGYWRFDDCTSTKATLNDLSSNIFTATKSGGISCSSSGKVKVAGSFDGSTGQAQVPDGALLDGAIANAVTVAAWVKPATLPTA